MDNKSGQKGNQQCKIPLQVLKQKEALIRARFSKQLPQEENKNKCSSCFKEIGFFSKKFYCKICARTLCSSCSSHFLSSLIDPNGPINKDVRLCLKCFNECKQFIESDDKNDNKRISVFNYYICQNYTQSVKIYLIKNLSEEDDSEVEPISLRIDTSVDNNYQFEKKLRDLIRFVFQQEKKLSSIPNFCEQYLECTLSFILFCLKNLRSQARKQEELKQDEKFHQIDINRYIMIKTCLSKEANKFYFINGIINSKNVARKNMKTVFSTSIKDQLSELLSPRNSNNQALNIQSSDINQGVRCMVISISLEFSSGNNYPDLSQIIQKQKTHFQTIVQAILSYKPQIIFCKENINQEILTQLEKEGISVVQKIKNIIILKIAECARCLIVDDISILLSCNKCKSPSNTSTSQTISYIGIWKSVKFQTYQYTNQSKTFMILSQSQHNSAYNVSLLITGSDLEILKQFKKNLQGLLFNLNQDYNIIQLLQGRFIELLVNDLFIFQQNSYITISQTPLLRTRNSLCKQSNDAGKQQRKVIVYSVT